MNTRYNFLKPIYVWYGAQILIILEKLILKFEIDQKICFIFSCLKYMFIYGMFCFCCYCIVFKVVHLHTIIMNFSFKLKLADIFSIFKHTFILKHMKMADNYIYTL